MNNNTLKALLLDVEVTFLQRGAILCLQSELQMLCRRNVQTQFPPLAKLIHRQSSNENELRVLEH